MCVHIYIYNMSIYIYIYGHPPKIYTRLFHTIPQVASATSRGFDVCINLAPNLGRRFMIVYVLDKLKCWRGVLFLFM